MSDELMEETPVEPPIRLAICIPWQDTVQAEFARSFAKLGMRIAMEFIVPGYADVSFQTIYGTYLAQQRMSLVIASLQWGATHLLWFDSDMVFPDHTFRTLLKHDVDIVGVNYARRRPPHSPVTFKTFPEDGSPEELCYTTDDKHGLEEVAGIGFGVVLMKASVFQSDDAPGIPLPAFRTHFDKGQAEGEDAFFCREAKKYGKKVYVDHDLSRDIGHMGVFQYKNQHSVIINEPKPLIVPATEIPNGPRLVL